MPSRTNEFIQLAKNLARKSQLSRHHGAVITKGKRVIGSGVNSFNKRAHNKWSIHAEENAIYDALNKGISLSGAKLYVVRLNRANQTKNSKPCNYCARLIIKVKIIDLYYTIDDTVTYIEIEIVTKNNVDTKCPHISAPYKRRLRGKTE